MPTKTERPSEGGHWYRLNDSGRVEQIASVPRARGGGERPCTLRDAKKDGGYLPGCTTILGQAHSPGLERYKMIQAAEAARRVPQGGQESEAEWHRRVLEVAAEHARSAASTGSAIHKAVEQFYSEEPFDKFFRGHVLGVADLIEQHCSTSETLHPWLAEKAVAHPWGYATRVDLCSEAWVLDFKTVSKTPQEIKDLPAWPTHAMQLAATRQAFDLAVPTKHKKDCAIVYISREHAGVCSFVQVDEEALEQGLACFKALLEFWQAKNKYRPEWRGENK